MGRAGQIGGAYERALLDYFRENDYDTERLRLTGKRDEGDLAVRLGYDRRLVIEAKNRKAMDLAGWVGEAETERDNYAGSRGLHRVDFAVVHKRRGKGVAHSFVTIPLFHYLEQLGD